MKEKRSLAQNKMIYALINDIVKHFCNDFEATHKRSFRNDVETVKRTLKVGFARESGLKQDFSTAKLSKDQATEFISYIIEFCFQFDVPLSRPGIEMTADINRYLFLCVKYRKCAITGAPGEIHHVNAIGMGRNRNYYDHSQSFLICLSREMHREAHQIGWEAFKRKYHVDGIRLTKEAAKEFGI
ncbi:putative HNHc nuclease [Listeria ilorinensis]|uniref:putative HNHc nuclease n=1 Tax=Listeria ilorinensis TaxID=2867439 RepID=UPI0025A5C67C|nr:putative HNHc nuclease [Listeria ilorinensis]